jgi:5-formyltetrahydrofolate cyclo-ligase
MTNNKEILRKRFLIQRKRLSSYDVFIKSWLAQENLLNSVFFSRSKTIGVYYPILNEVQTFRIINKSISAKKKICIPKLLNDEIIFFSIANLNDLIVGKFNIKEPIINTNNKCIEIDTVIAPGIVFDRFGYRIGFGKGYYDKFLKLFSKKNTITIGLGYDFQLISDIITHESHDVKLDVLITNREILLI